LDPSSTSLNIIRTEIIIHKVDIAHCKEFLGEERASEANSNLKEEIDTKDTQEIAMMDATEKNVLVATNEKFQKFKESCKKSI
jgi:hypothetical protein